MAKIDQANVLLRKALKQYTHFVYHRKLRDLQKASPALFVPRARDKEAAHLALWRPLSKRVDVNWYRFFANLGGDDDPNFVPDNLYHAIIEKTLNDINYAWVFADKNFYQSHFDSRFFPRTFLRNVAGEFLDQDYRPITERVAKGILFDVKSDVIVKPSIDSGSGHMVRKLSYVKNSYFLDSKPTNWEEIISTYRRNFLVQEVLSQHASIERLNPSSVNTLRVFTYRSVKDDVVYVKTRIVRVGRAGLYVDNGHMGGLICSVQSDGRISPQAADLKGLVYQSHPDNGYAFEGLSLPRVEGADEICRRVAAQVYSSRTISFDVSIRDNSEPVLIEINTFGQGAHMSQFFSPGLFGSHTQEVIDYCLKNRNRDDFKILRLFG